MLLPCFSLVRFFVAQLQVSNVKSLTGENIEYGYFYGTYFIDWVQARIYEIPIKKQHKKARTSQKFVCVNELESDHIE